MDKPRSSHGLALPLPIKAVLLDAYGALFDVYSDGLLAEQLFPGRSQAIGLLWRDKQIESSRLVTTGKRGPNRESVCQSFGQLTRSALLFAIKKIAAGARKSWASGIFGTNFEPQVANAVFKELGTQPTRTGNSLRDVLSFF